MSKKSVAMIVVGVAVVFFILGAYFFQSDNSNEAEDERTNEIEDTKDALEAFKKEEDFMTKEEISDEINKYKSQIEDNDDGLGDKDIKEKIEEEFGAGVARSYENGQMIDADMDDEDAKQVMIEGLISKPFGINPIKKIVNPVESEFGNTEENRYASVTEIKSMVFENQSYYTKDTEGFREIEGLNIGYPMIYRGSDGDVTVSLSLMIDEDIKSEDIDKFLEKYKKVEVNGHKLTEDTIAYAEDSIYNETRDEFDFEDRDIALFKDSIFEVWIDMPMEDVFKENEEFDELFEVMKEGEEGSEEAIEKMWGELLDEKPVIDLNGIEWVLEDDVKIGDPINSEGVIEYDIDGDYLIKPEIYGE